MIIIVRNTSNTYSAQLRSSAKDGLQKLASASCTMGPQHAASAVAAKLHPGASSNEHAFKLITDTAEIARLTDTGKLFRGKYKPASTWVYTFNPEAK